MRRQLVSRFYEVWVITLSSSFVDVTQPELANQTGNRVNEAVASHVTSERSRYSDDVLHQSAFRAHPEERWKGVLPTELRVIDAVSKISAKRRRFQAHERAFKMNNLPSSGLNAEEELESPAPCPSADQISQSCDSAEA